MPEFSGLVAVITGGAGGIGLATAQTLVDRGARACVLDLAISGLPEGTHGYVCDIRDDAEVRSTISRIVTDHGRIDVLVNNAGVGAVGTVSDNTDDEWHRVLDLNLMGAVRMCRAALPHLRRSPSPAIVNTCSVVATVGLPGRALYSASKAALLGLTRAMAADLVAEGIRVNCVSPGTVDTAWVGRVVAASNDPEATRAAMVARQPHGRLVTAAEVASAIVYLASPLSGSITGIDHIVDGGLSAVRLAG
jgi:NAD(P)-dependent dehydrogenase (short-subunit alcohol dehydrogenase family)